MRYVIAALKKAWPVATGGILVIITALSLIPLPELPLSEVRFSDKMHHLVAYGLLALPVAVARPRYWIAILAVLLAWSGSIEILQPYVNRHGEWADLFANALGMAIGIAAGTVLRKLA